MSVALPLCHPCYGPDLDLDLLRSPAIPSLSVPYSLPVQTTPQVHLSMACAPPWPGRHSTPHCVLWELQQNIYHHLAPLLPSPRESFSLLCRQLYTCPGSSTHAVTICLLSPAVRFLDCAVDYLKNLFILSLFWKRIPPDPLTPLHHNQFFHIRPYQKTTYKYHTKLSTRTYVESFTYPRPWQDSNALGSSCIWSNATPGCSIILRDTDPIYLVSTTSCEPSSSNWFFSVRWSCSAQSIGVQFIQSMLSVWSPNYRCIRISGHS